MGNFSCFSLLIFFKINFLKNYFRNTILVSNRLDPDQDRHFVEPDLVPTFFKGYEQTPLVGSELIKIWEDSSEIKENIYSCKVLAYIGIYQVLYKEMVDIQPSMAFIKCNLKNGIIILKKKLCAPWAYYMVCPLSRDM